MLRMPTTGGGHRVQLADDRGGQHDQQPGDDALSVVLIPHDDQGELVKIPGKILVEAFDLGGTEGTEPIGRWSYDLSEVRQHWHKGVIQSGYQFELPLEGVPRSDKVLLHGRLVTSDGRQFDTSHEIRITPPGDDPVIWPRCSAVPESNRRDSVHMRRTAHSLAHHWRPWDT